MEWKISPSEEYALLRYQLEGESPTTLTISADHLVIQLQEIANNLIRRGCVQLKQPKKG